VKSQHCFILFLRSHPERSEGSLFVFAVAVAVAVAVA
jgi:hypothetical protein